METARTEALQCLSQEHPCDFNMLVYTATDQVQHHFWHFMDARHDQHDSERAQRYGNAIRNVYMHIDRLIGSLLSAADDNTIVVVMSDHGCGPTTNVRLRLNQALEQAGLLAFRPTGRLGRGLRGVAGGVDWLLRSTLSDGVKRLLAGLFPRLRVWFEQLDEAGIDWTRTSAYVNEAFRSSPAVWLCNPRSPQSAGVLAAAETALRELVDPQAGCPVISRVYRTSDLYEGPFAEKAPDLIPSWWTDGFLVEQSVPGGASQDCVERSHLPVRGGVEFSGSHRLHGVFAMSGGPVRCGHVFRGARIIDVAPTILYLMGLPVPAEMDGRPLLEALDPVFVGNHPPRYEDGLVPPLTPAADAQPAFSSEEEELIAQRLRSMGYIE
jgi:predicted AlkP superfamily phosphohydrolase/phosphomutase